MTDFNPKEYKVTALRECPIPEEMPDLRDAGSRRCLLENAHRHAIRISTRNANASCVCLNVRKRVKGHQLVTIGTMDMMLTHAREIFRRRLSVQHVHRLDATIT